MRAGIVDRCAFALLWLLIFTLPVEKSFEIPGAGTISKLVAVPGLAMALLSAAVRREFRLPGPAFVLASAWVLLSAFSRWWTVSPDDTGERSTTLISLLMMVWAIHEVCRTGDRIRSLCAAYVAGTVAAAVTAVINYVNASASVYQRYGAEGFDPNDFALTMALSLPLSYVLSLETSGWKAWFYRLQMVLACGSILLSASRGGLLAMCLALSIVPLTLAFRPRAYRNRVIAAGIAALAAAPMLVPATSWRRLSTLSSEVSEGTLNSRTVLWHAGFEAWQEAPLLGAGAGAFPEAVTSVMGRPRHWTPVAHNTFLSVFVETGAAGFVLFFSFLLLLAMHALAHTGLDRRMWLVTLAVWGLGVMSLTWENRKPTWFLFGVLLAARPTAMALQKKPDAPPLWQAQRSFSA